MIQIQIWYSDDCPKTEHLRTRLVFAILIPDMFNHQEVDVSIRAEWFLLREELGLGISPTRCSCQVRSPSSPLTKLGLARSLQERNGLIGSWNASLLNR